MRISRKSVLRKQLVIRGNRCELINLPRRRVVVVEQSEKRLFFAAQVAVERPCKHSLRTNHERQLCIHAAAAWFPIPSSTACGEFVEPDRLREISLGQERLKDTTHWVAGIKSFRGVRNV